MPAGCEKNATYKYLLGDPYPGQSHAWIKHNHAEPETMTIAAFGQATGKAKRYLISFASKLNLHSIQLGRVKGRGQQNVHMQAAPLRTRRPHLPALQGDGATRDAQSESEASVTRARIIKARKGLEDELQL